MIGSRIATLVGSLAKYDVNPSFPWSDSLWCAPVSYMRWPAQNGQYIVGSCNLFVDFLEDIRHGSIFPVLGHYIPLSSNCW